MKLMILQKKAQTNYHAFMQAKKHARSRSQATEAKVAVKVAKKTRKVASVRQSTTKEQPKTVRDNNHSQVYDLNPVDEVQF